MRLTFAFCAFLRLIISLKFMENILVLAHTEKDGSLAPSARGGDPALNDKSPDAIAQEIVECIRK